MKYLFLSMFRIEDASENTYAYIGSFRLFVFQSCESEAAPVYATANVTLAAPSASAAVSLTRFMM